MEVYYSIRRFPKLNCEHLVRQKIFMTALSELIFDMVMHLPHRCESVHYGDFPCDHNAHNNIINPARQRNVTPLKKVFNRPDHHDI